MSHQLTPSENLKLEERIAKHPTYNNYSCKLLDHFDKLINKGKITQEYILEKCGHWKIDNSFLSPSFKGKKCC